jgi:alpha-beta hydrolase superfamily lysophospholipase
MKKHITLIAIVVALLASCQPATKDEQNVSTGTKDTTASQAIRATDTGHAAINGLQMYYEVYGSGKPLVLLHGSLMTIHLNWAHIIPLLAKDRKVIVAEMQGQGRTRDIEREISYEVMADDVSALLKHLKIDSADILGFSMGGGIAYQVAVRHPEQVRRSTNRGLLLYRALRILV